MWLLSRLLEKFHHGFLYGRGRQPCHCSDHKTRCLSGPNLELKTVQGSGRVAGPQSVLEAWKTLVLKISKGTISRGSSRNQLWLPGSQATEKALLCCVSRLSAYIRSINQDKSWFLSLSKIFLKARGERLLIYLYNQNLIKML